MLHRPVRNASEVIQVSDCTATRVVSILEWTDGIPVHLEYDWTGVLSLVLKLMTELKYAEILLLN